MFTANTGYGHYRFRPSGLVVQATQLTIYNLKHVSEWIRANGGAVTGMQVIDQGEITKRGIWLGTITGDVVGGGDRDWMVLGPTGFSVWAKDRFALVFEGVEASQGGGVLVRTLSIH